MSLVTQKSKGPSCTVENIECVISQPKINKDQYLTYQKGLHGLLIKMEGQQLGLKPITHGPP